MDSHDPQMIVECPVCKLPIGRLIFVADFEPLQAIDAFGNTIDADYYGPGWIVEHPGRRSPCKLSAQQSAAMFPHLRRLS